MAITTLDQAVAGARAPESIFKVGTAAAAAGRHHSLFYAAGRPGAAAAPSPGINGAALTSYAGQIPFTNPSGGALSYLLKLAMSGATAGQILLLDRLWHNSGLNLTLTTPQVIVPAAIPARDRDGLANGTDILAGLEFSAAGGAGTPTVTLTYTDEANNVGQTANFVGTASPPAGTMFLWPLAAGDLGVRAVTQYQQSATWTSGTAHIVLFRILAMLDLTSANIGNAIDAVTGGFPKLYDNTVPFIVVIPSATTATNYTGQMIVTQG